MRGPAAFRVHSCLSYGAVVVDAATVAIWVGFGESFHFYTTFLTVGFQNLVRSLERSRAAVAEDLTSVSGKYEKVCDEVQQIPQLKLRLEVGKRRKGMGSALS